MAELSQVLTSEVIKRSFNPILQQMAKDKIPNIRLNVAKTIYSIRQRMQAGQIGPMENAIESDLLAILNDLKSDEDDDVKFYSKKAISMLR